MYYECNQEGNSFSEPDNHRGCDFFCGVLSGVLFFAGNIGGICEVRSY